MLLKNTLFPASEQVKSLRHTLSSPNNRDNNPSYQQKPSPSHFSEIIVQTQSQMEWMPPPTGPAAGEC